MKKLRMSVDELKVESFTTALPTQTRGTVEAHQIWISETRYTYCQDCHSAIDDCNTTYTGPEYYTCNERPGCGPADPY